MSKPCCSAKTAVHWRSLRRPDGENGSDQTPPLADGWSSEHLESSLSASLSRPQTWADADVAIILTSANILRGCEACKLALREHFGVPSFWWSAYCHNANGYFGSAATKGEEGETIAHISWARFRVKLVHDANHYAWYKINVFVHWLPNRSTILLFDTPPTLSTQIPESFFRELSLSELFDPFWIYGYLVGEVVSLQDKMVWDFRTKIRTMEKARGSSGAPQPDFGRLHDLARHSVHFLETFQLAIKTISDILRDHAALSHAPRLTDTASPPAPGVRDKLRFFENMLENLQQRASSNHQRLHNEIQLTFNLVTQYDAKVSLNLSSAMRADGAATKVLTLLASAFLPATFICALFSMSFFSYEPETGWVMAGQIWIYFAFAIPITLTTFGLWRYGPAIYPTGGALEPDRDQ